MSLNSSLLTNTFFFIMSLELALGMLSQGNSGDEILQILDVIVNDTDTPEEITFWDTPVRVYKGG